MNLVSVNYDVNASGVVGIDSDGAMTLGGASIAATADAAGGMQLVTSDAAGEIVLQSAHTAGRALFIDANANAGSIVDIDAGILDIDADGAITIDAATTMTIKGAGVSKYGDDAATWDFDGSGALSETGMTSATITPSGAITLTAGAASTFSTGAGQFTLTSAAELELNGASLDANFTGGLAIDSTDTSDIKMTANDNDNPKTLTIEAANAGSNEAIVQLKAKNVVKTVIGTDDKITVNASGVQLGGANARVTTILDEDTLNSDSATALATQQSIKAYVDSQAGLALVTLTTDGTGVAAGDVVAIDSAGKATKADADAIATCNVVGIAVSTVGGNGTLLVKTSGNQGGYTIAGGDVGKKLYASLTAGGITSTAPSGNGDVVYQIGFARSTSEIIIAPQFIMEIGSSLSI